MPTERTRTKNPAAKVAAIPAEEVDKDEIEVVEDVPEVVPEGAEPAVTESAEELRAQIEAANRRAEEAEARAARAETQTTTAASEVETSNMRVIESAIGKAESDLREIRAALKTAKETGDYDAEIEATDKLQKANIQLAVLNNGKTELERRIEDRKNAPTDPVERYASTLSPRDAQWVRAHPEIIRDDNRRKEMESAHFLALSKRIVPGTDEYYDLIETQLGLKQGADDGETQGRINDGGQAPARRAAAPAAPPSRTTSTTQTSTRRNLPFGVEDLGGGRYRLSPERREGARISGMSDGDYLKHLLALHDEGRTLN